jgi:D-sedoheptulose 7-phosphate isomerase
MSNLGISEIYLRNLKHCIDRLDRCEFDRGVELVETAWKQGRQIVAFGNGGSALTALHFITDWNKMIHSHTARPFRGRTLLDNIGIATAYANDISYSEIFSEQIKNIATPGDLVIAISASGESENVLRAVKTAEEAGCRTIGLCGLTHCSLSSIAYHAIHANSTDTQICEDVHALFGHMVMKYICHGTA